MKTIVPQSSMDEYGASTSAGTVPSSEGFEAALNAAERSLIGSPEMPYNPSATFGPGMTAHSKAMRLQSHMLDNEYEAAEQQEKLSSSSFNKEQQGPDYDSLNRLRLAYAAKKDYMGDNTVVLPDGSEFHRAGGEKNNWTTQLLPNEDRAYRDWVRANHMQKYEGQYDLAAFWKNGVNSAAGYSAADFEKVKSTFEKPSSPTFTDESFYHNELNLSKGHWLTTKSGKSHFVTSETAEYLGAHGQNDTDIDDKAIDRILSLNKEELLLNRYMDEDPSGVKAAHFLHDIKKVSPTNFSALMEMKHIKQYHLQEQEVWKKRFPDGFDKDGVWETNMHTGSSVQWDSEKLRKGENPIIEPFRNATNLGYDVDGSDEYKKRMNPLHESWGQKIGNLFSSIMGGAKPDTPFSHSFTVHAPGEKNWFGIATSAFIKPMGDLGVWCARFLSNLADADPTLHGVAQYINQAADKAEIDMDTELGNDMALAKHGDNWYNPYRLTNSTFGLLGTGVKIMVMAAVGQQLAGGVGAAFGAGGGVGSMLGMGAGEAAGAAGADLGLMEVAKNPKLIAQKGADLFKWGMSATPKKIIQGIASSMLGITGMFASEAMVEKQEELQASKEMMQDKALKTYLKDLVTTDGITPEEYRRVEVNANMSNAEERAQMLATGATTMLAWEAAPRLWNGMNGAKYFSGVLSKISKGLGANTAQTYIAPMFLKFAGEEGLKAQLGRAAYEGLSSVGIPATYAGMHMGVVTSIEDGIRGIIDNFTYNEKYHWEKLPSKFATNFFTGVAFHVPHMANALHGQARDSRHIAAQNYVWFKKSYDEGMASVEKDIHDADNHTDPNMRVFERTMHLCDYMHRNKITEAEFKAASDLAAGDKIALPFKKTSRGAINLLDLINESGFTGESWDWHQRQRIVDMAMNLKWIDGLRSLKGYDKNTDMEIFDPVVGAYNDMKRWTVDHSISWGKAKVQVQERIGIEKTQEIVDHIMGEDNPVSLDASQTEMAMNEIYQKILFAHDGKQMIEEKIGILNGQLEKIMSDLAPDKSQYLGRITAMVKAASKAYEPTRYKRHAETGNFVYDKHGNRVHEFNPESHEQYILRHIKSMDIDAMDPAHRKAFEIQTALQYLIDLRESGYQKGLDEALSKEGMNSICNEIRQKSDAIHKAKNDAEAGRTEHGQGLEKIEEDKTEIEDRNDDEKAAERLSRVDSEIEGTENEEAMELRTRSTLTEDQKDLARIRTEQKRKRAEEEQQRWQQEDEQKAKMAEETGEEPPSPLDQAGQAVQESEGDQQAVDEYANVAQDIIRRHQFEEKNAASEPDGIQNGMSLGNHSELIGDVAKPNCNSGKEYDELCRHLSGGFNRLNEAMINSGEEGMEGLPQQGAYRDPNSGLEYIVSRNDDGTFALKFMGEEEIPFDTYREMMESASEKIGDFMKMRNFREKLQKLRELTSDQIEPIKGTGRKAIKEQNTGRTSKDSIKPDDGYKPTKTSWSVGATPKERSDEGAGWKKVNNPSIPNEDFNTKADGSSPSIKFNHNSNDYKEIFLRRTELQDPVEAQETVRRFTKRMAAYHSVVDTLLDIKDKGMRNKALNIIKRTDRRTWEEVVRTIPLVHDCKAGKMFLDTAYNSEYASPGETEHQKKVFAQREKLVEHMLMNDGEATGYKTERVFRGIKKAEEKQQPWNMSNKEDKRKAKSFSEHAMFEGAKVSVEPMRGIDGKLTSEIVINTKEGGKFALKRQALGSRGNGKNSEFCKGLASLIYDVCSNNELMLDSENAKQYNIKLPKNTMMNGMDVVRMFIEDGGSTRWASYLKIGDGKIAVDDNPERRLADDMSDKDELMRSFLDYQFPSKRITMSELAMDKTIPVDFAFGELRFNRGDTWLKSMMSNGYLMGDFDTEQPYRDSTLNMIFGETQGGTTEAHNEDYERACGQDLGEIKPSPNRSAVMPPDERSIIKDTSVSQKTDIAPEGEKQAENKVSYPESLKEDSSAIKSPVAKANESLKEEQDLLDDFVDPEAFGLYRVATEEEQASMSFRDIQNIESQKHIFRTMLSEKTGGTIKGTDDNRISLGYRLETSGVTDDVPVKDIADLLEQSGAPHYFHAAMTVDGTIIYNKADGSALYHEAFHRVSQLYLNDTERQKIYEDTKKTWAYTRKMSDAQIEEFLAEKFREDVISRETTMIEHTDNMVVRFLKSMWQFIKQYLFDVTPNVEGYEKLRDDIISGQYRFVKADTKSIQEFKDRYPDEYVGFENKGVVFPHIPHKLAYDNIVKSMLDKVLTFEGGHKDQAILKDRNLSTLSKEEKSEVYDGINKLIKANLEKELENYEMLVERKPHSVMYQRGLAVREDLLQEKGLERLVVDVLKDYSTMRGVRGQIDEYESTDDLGQMMQYYEGADKRDPWDRTSDRLMAVIGHLRTGIDKSTGFFKYEAIGTAKARLMTKLGGKFKTVDKMMESIKEEADKFTSDPRGHAEGVFYRELYNKLEGDMYLQNAAFSTFSKQRVRFIDAKDNGQGEYMPVYSETQGAKRLLQRWTNTFSGLGNKTDENGVRDKVRISMAAAGLSEFYSPDNVLTMIGEISEGISKTQEYTGIQRPKMEDGKYVYGKTYKTTVVPTPDDLKTGKVKIVEQTTNRQGDTVYTLQNMQHEIKAVKAKGKDNVASKRAHPSFDEYCDDIQNLLGQTGGMNISKEDLNTMANMAVQSKRYEDEWIIFNSPDATEQQRDLARISALERVFRGENVGKFEFKDGTTGTPLFSSNIAQKEGGSLYDDLQTVIRYSNQPSHERRVNWSFEDGREFSFERNDLLQYTCPAFNRIAEWTMRNGSESEETFVYNAEGDAIYLMREPCAFADQLDTHINDPEYIDGFLNDPRMEGSDTLRNIHQRMQDGKEDSGITMHEVLNIGLGWNRTSYGKATDQAICKVRHDLALNDVSCLRQISDKGKLIAIKGMNNFHDIYKNITGDPLAVERHLATGHGVAEYKAVRHAHYARAKFVGDMLRKDGEIGKKDIQEWNEMTGRQQQEVQAGRSLKSYGMVQGYHYKYVKETDNQGRVIGWKTELAGKGYNMRFFDFLEKKIAFFGENTKVNLQDGKDAIDADAKRVMNDQSIIEKINDHLTDYIGKHITELERMGMVTTKGHTPGDRLTDLDSYGSVFGNNNKGVESKDLLYDWVGENLAERGAFDNIEDSERISQIINVAAELRYSILAQLYNDIENNILFEGDPAFVGGYAGQTKRISGAFSPGKPFQSDFPEGDEDYNRKTFRRLNVHDAVIFHPEDHQAMAAKRAAALEATGLSKEEAQKRASKETEGVLNVMSSDGQSLMSPSMARQMMKRLGLWDIDKQAAFEKWKAGGNPEEFAKTNLCTVMKCVYWGRESVGQEFSDGGADNLSSLTGYGFHKTSYAPMFNLHSDHPLWDVMLWMEKNDVGVLAFNSATKSFGTDCLHLFDYEGKVIDGALDSGAGMCITEHEWNNLRWQLPFNPHGETVRKIGVQGMKILMADANVEQAQKMDKLIGDISERLASKISTADSSKDAVKTLLTRGIKTGKNSTNLNTAIALGMDMGKLRNSDAVNTIFKGLQKSTSTNTPGFSSVQVSGVGRSELRLFNERGCSDMAVNRSCLDGLFPKGCSHEMAQVLFEKARRELGGIDVMSYRIPTQGCASIHHMDVVEMMPDMSGDIAYVPDGLYAIFGCDNDGDKLYNGAMSYKFKIGEGKEGSFKQDLNLKEKFTQYVQSPKIESEIEGGGIGALQDDPTYDYISEAHKFAKDHWAVYDEDRDIFLTCSNKRAFLENTTYSKMDTGTAGMLNDYMNTCFDVLDSKHASTVLATTSSIDGPVSAVKDLINTLTPSEEKNGFYSLGWIPQVENRQNNLGCNEIIGPLALATSMKGIYDERRTYGDTGTHVSPKSKGFKKGSRTFNTMDLSLANKEHLFNANGGTISDDLMTATSLAVDGSKDPIILRANVNSSTVNAFAFCLLEGHGKAAYALCSNPIVRDFGNITGKLKFQNTELNAASLNSEAIDQTLIRWARVVDAKVKDSATLTNFLMKEIQPMMANREHPNAVPNYMDFDFLKKQCDTFNKADGASPSNLPNSKQFAKSQIAVFMHFLHAQKEMRNLRDDLAINGLDKGTGTSFQDNYNTIKQLCRSGLIDRNSDAPLNIASYLAQFKDRDALKYYDVKTREYLATYLQASSAGPLEFTQQFLNNFSKLEKNYINNGTNSKSVNYRTQELLSRSMWGIALHAAGAPMERLVADDYTDKEMSLRGRMENLYDDGLLDRDNPVVRQWKEHQEYRNIQGKSKSLSIRIKDIKDKEMNETYMQAFRDMRTYAMEQGADPEDMKRFDDFINDYITYQYISSGSHIASHLIPAELIDTHPYIGKATEMIRNGTISEEEIMSAAVRHLAVMNKNDMSIKTYGLNVHGVNEGEQSLIMGKNRKQAYKITHAFEAEGDGCVGFCVQPSKEGETMPDHIIAKTDHVKGGENRVFRLGGYKSDPKDPSRIVEAWYYGMDEIGSPNGPSGGYTALVPQDDITNTTEYKERIHKELYDYHEPAKPAEWADKAPEGRRTDKNIYQELKAGTEPFDDLSQANLEQTGSEMDAMPSEVHTEIPEEQVVENPDVTFGEPLVSLKDRVNLAIDADKSTVDAYLSQDDFKSLLKQFGSTNKAEIKKNIDAIFQGYENVGIDGTFEISRPNALLLEKCIKPYGYEVHYDVINKQAEIAISKVRETPGFNVITQSHKEEVFDRAQAAIETAKEGGVLDKLVACFENAGEFAPSIIADHIEDKAWARNELLKALTSENVNGEAFNNILQERYAGRDNIIDEYHEMSDAAKKELLKKLFLCG